MKPTNWINRYVDAVVRRLPEKSRTDVREELTSLLEEEAEEKFDQEISNIDAAELKQWIESKEHPSIAAVAYRKEKTLIDESVYPLFREAFKGVLVVVGIIVILKVFLSYAIGSTPLMTMILRAGNEYLETFLFAFGALTLIFHLFSKYFNAREWHKNWKAETLSVPTENWRNIPYSQSIAEIVMFAVLIAFLSGITAGISDRMSPGEAKSIHIGDAFVDNLAWIYGLAILNFGIAVYHLIRPIWHRWNLVVYATICLAIAVLLFYMANYDSIAFIDVSQVEHPEKFDRIGEHLHQVLATTLRIAGLINLYYAGKSIYRFFKI